MSTLDIRNQQVEEITEIKFDDSGDNLLKDKNILMFYDKSEASRISLCTYEDLDNFIAACQKAKELWAK